MDLGTLNPVSLLPEMILAGAGLAVLLVNALGRGRADGLSPWLAALATLAALLACLFPVTRQAGYFGSVASDALAYAGRAAVLVPLLLLLLGGGRTLASSRLPRAEALALALFAATGMLALASAGDLITLFLAVETLSLASYALAGLLGNRVQSRHAALTYFLTGSFASAFLLFGLALLFGATGSLELGGLGAGALKGGAGSSWIALGGVALVLAGFLFKIGAVPFQSWVPEVYAGSPSWVSAFLATSAKAAAVAGFGRLLLGLAPQSASWVPLLGIAAGLTMVLGNFAALVQTSFKRMLAWSAVAHAGYLTLGLASVGQAGENLEAVLFYLLPYGLINAPLFLIGAHVARASGTGQRLENFKGLARRDRGLAFWLTVLLLALAGIPPLAGFMGKFLVFSAAVRAGLTGWAILGVLTSVVAVFTYLRPVVYAWFHEPADENAWSRDRALCATSALASLLLLALGVWPQLWLRWTQGVGL